jgi:hypothetical protein
MNKEQNGRAPVERTVRLKDYHKKQELIGKFVICMIIGRATRITCLLKHGSFETKLDAEEYLSKLYNPFFKIERVSEDWPEDILL